MGVRVTWADPTVDVDEYRVYRGSSPLNPSSLPAPIAVVGPSETHFDDGGVVADTTYYYIVASVSPTGTAFTPMRSVFTSSPGGP